MKQKIIDGIVIIFIWVTMFSLVTARVAANNHVNDIVLVGVYKTWGDIFILLFFAGFLSIVLSGCYLGIRKGIDSL